MANNGCEPLLGMEPLLACCEPDEPLLAGSAELEPLLGSSATTERRGLDTLRGLSFCFSIEIGDVSGLSGGVAFLCDPDLTSMAGLPALLGAVVTLVAAAAGWARSIFCAADATSDARCFTSIAAAGRRCATVGCAGRLEDTCF